MIRTHKSGDRILRHLLRDLKYRKSNFNNIWSFRKKTKYTLRPTKFQLRHVCSSNLKTTTLNMY